MGEERVGVVGSNKGFYCISQMFFAVFFLSLGDFALTSKSADY